MWFASGQPFAGKAARELDARCRPNTSNPCRWKKPIGSGRRAAGDQLSSSEQQPISAATYFFPLSSSGGGFAGAYCVRALSVGLRQAAADALALVADQNVMLFHPMLAEVSGSSISPLHVVNPLRRFCRGASISPRRRGRRPGGADRALLARTLRSRGHPEVRTPRPGHWRRGKFRPRLGPEGSDHTDLINLVATGEGIMLEAQFLFEEAMARLRSRPGSWPAAWAFPWSNWWQRGPRPILRRW